MSKLNNTYSSGSDSPAVEKAILTFMIVSAFFGLAMGLSDSVLANYFKEAYNADARQRGFIELPRELPGVVSLLTIALLAPLGNLKGSVISALLFFAGICALAIFRPEFSVMLVLLFVYSLGMHMFTPFNDSIGIALAVRGNTGKMLGRFKSMTMIFTVVAAVTVFFGFRYGLFGFDTPVTIFFLSAASMLVIALLFIAMSKAAPSELQVPRPSSNGLAIKSLRQNMVFRKEYARYYLISALFGGRKQIMFVYSPWVLIDLLGFKADNMALLAIIGSFIGVFFMPVIGRMIDRYGTRKVMLIEALAFVFIYIAYGFLSGWVSARQGAVALTGIGMALVYLLNIVDRMSSQFAMVRSIYLQSIALKKEDVTPSLTVGMAIDHIVSIIGSLVCGTVWYVWGPQYVFVIAGVMSLLNLIVAAGIKPSVGEPPVTPSVNEPPVTPSVGGPPATPSVGGPPAR